MRNFVEKSTRSKILMVMIQNIVVVFWVKTGGQENYPVTNLPWSGDWYNPGPPPPPPALSLPAPVQSYTLYRSVQPASQSRPTSPGCPARPDPPGNGWGQRELTNVKTYFHSQVRSRLRHFVLDFINFSSKSILLSCLDLLKINQSYFSFL